MTLGTEIESELNRVLSSAEICSDFVDGRYDRVTETRDVTYEIRWRTRYGAKEPRELVGPLLDLPGILEVRWSGTA